MQKSIYYKKLIITVETTNYNSALNSYNYAFNIFSSLPITFFNYKRAFIEIFKSFILKHVTFEAVY